MIPATDKMSVTTMSRVIVERSCACDETTRAVRTNKRAEVLKSARATAAPPAQPFVIFERAMQERKPANSKKYVGRRLALPLNRTDARAATQARQEKTTMGR